MQAPIFDFAKVWSNSAFRLLFGVKWCILGLEFFRKRGLFMITVRGIITLLVLAVLFALAVVWVSKQGGWKGEGCGGNCASCHQHCDTPEKKH